MLLEQMSVLSIFYHFTVFFLKKNAKVKQTDTLGTLPSSFQTHQQRSLTQLGRLSVDLWQFSHFKCIMQTGFYLKRRDLSSGRQLNPAGQNSGKTSTCWNSFIESHSYMKYFLIHYLQFTLLHLRTVASLVAVSPCITEQVQLLR